MCSAPFQLEAEVRTANRHDVLAAVQSLLPDVTIEETELGFNVRGQIEGVSARDLNRRLLSALRRV